MAHWHHHQPATRYTTVMLEPSAIVLLALVLDMAIGDPRTLYRHVAHPVVLIGRVIDFGDRVLNSPGAAPAKAIASGALLVILVLGASIVIGWLMHTALARVAFGGYLEALFVSTLLAFRSLFDHVRAVALALEDSLDTARIAVAHIVGRDPDSLDGPAVARAAIESAAENFSDGVVAPVFWAVLLGLPGILAYKAINTLDSMIGHRTPRHLYFGRVAAHLDDIANWVPARLSGVLFCIAASFTPGANARSAWSSMLRDARKHRSPNAGWQEAAVAGALGIALAGPRQYGDERVNDAWLGHPPDSSRDSAAQHATAADVHRALRLYLIAGAVLTALLLTTVLAMASMH
ncbi:MAG: adenosylcobinamide-phosphate synthase [Gammaproteobacteria bacterium]|jgi:adenosylcobinamide-phosphate synthase